MLFLLRYLPNDYKLSILWSRSWLTTLLTVWVHTRLLSHQQSPPPRMACVDESSSNSQVQFAGFRYVEYHDIE